MKVPFNQAGSTVTIGSGYQHFFSQKNSDRCGVESCSLLKQDCSSPFTNKDHLTFSGSSTYQLSASEVIKLGYKHSICLSCKLTEQSGSIEFKSNVLSIVGLPDCSSALTSKKSEDAYKVNYDKKGTSSKIGNGYLTFFRFQTGSECMVDSCFLKGTNCFESFDQKDVEIENMSPFVIKAKTNIENGYEHDFCLECKIGKNSFYHKGLKI